MVTHTTYYYVVEPIDKQNTANRKTFLKFELYAVFAFVPSNIVLYFKSSSPTPMRSYYLIIRLNIMTNIIFDTAHMH